MEGEQPYLGDLLTMAINHLLTGMILQVGNNVRCWRFLAFEENPSLAKKLIQVLIQRGKKRSREERSDASNSSKWFWIRRLIYLFARSGL